MRRPDNQEFRAQPLSPATPFGFYGIYGSLEGSVWYLGRRAKRVYANREPFAIAIFERPDMTVKAYASEAWRLHGQDADPDVAILKEAKAEYAKLQ